jgi:hypothetical protein
MASSVHAYTFLFVAGREGRMKIPMIMLGDVYASPTNRWIMKREYHSRTPNNNQMGGRWVLRDENDVMIDFDQYRHDLADRQNLELIGTE